MHIYILIFIYIYFFQPKLIRNFSRRLSNRLIRLFVPNIVPPAEHPAAVGFPSNSCPRKQKLNSCSHFGSEAAVASSASPLKKEQNWGGGNKFPSPARFRAIPRDDVTTRGDGGGDEALVSWSPVRGGHTVHGERQESK